VVHDSGAAVGLRASRWACSSRGTEPESHFRAPELVALAPAARVGRLQRVRASEEVLGRADDLEPVLGGVSLKRFDNRGVADNVVADGFARLANVVLEPAGREQK
jgi:hypothetical protein